MANNHYRVNEKVTVKLELEVTLTNISNYHALSEEAQKEVVDEFKKEIGAHLANLVCKSYSQEEIVCNCDYVSFDVNCHKPQE